MVRKVLVGVAAAAMGWAATAGEALKLRGAWEMEQATAPGVWMPAVVPGTVLTTLVKNGKLPDPYWGLNNKRDLKIIPDLYDVGRDYYTARFRSTFDVPADWKDQTIWIRPEGINYRGEIYLNGKLAAVTAGMFARTPVEVTDFLKVGETNAIEVKVYPVDHPGKPEPKKWGAVGEWRNGGDGEIGRNVTMLMSAGWDFTFNDGIRDRNTGIWKDITLFATGAVKLDAPFVKTKLNADNTEATLDIEVEVANANSNRGLAEADLEVAVEGTDLRFSRKVLLLRGERKVERFTAKLANPRLWWPRNKGPQNLYRATFSVSAGTLDGWAWDTEHKKKWTSPVAPSHAIATTFGVREAYSDQRGKDGARQFWINGRRIFIRGTNWIPEAMLKADDARMEAEVRLTAESGVNLVRLWGGGIVESDRFYELCDKYGLLVWQEFWMTGDTRHPDDEQLYLANVAAAVKRIRMHPSLCHYVCSNESTEVAGIKELLEKLDGTRSYMMQSECDGVHDGSPYFPVNPMRYYTDTASPRGSRVCGFNPEYGTCALPPAECCRAFMPEELLWPVEKNVEAWKYREGGGFDKMTEFHHAAVNAYGASKSFDEYARKSQAADALAHRALWETWNLVRESATGLLFWYNNTPIPQLGGHTWDYSLVCTASQFAQANALEPLHAQYEYLSNRVSIVSDIYETRTLAVKAEVYDFASRKVWEKTGEATVKGETCVTLFTIPFGTELVFDKPHFIKLRLLENGEEIASTFYWRSNSAFTDPAGATGPCVGGFEELDNLPKTTLAARQVSDADGKLVVEVENTGDKLAFMTELRLEGADGKYLKPVFFSDNFFALLPGEKKTVVAEHPAASYTWRVQSWNAR